jgi:hypothetical protein
MALKIFFCSIACVGLDVYSQTIFSVTKFPQGVFWWILDMFFYKMNVIEWHNN